jgi:hypothetical protein
MMSQLSIELPSSDVSFLKQIGEKMGWTIYANEKTANADKMSTNRQHSTHVERLRQLCQDTTFSEKEINDDERLKYILER